MTLGVALGVLGVLVGLFLTLGLRVRGAEPDRIPGATAAVADRYTPRGVTVGRGQHRGELIVTWGMPIRPDVVATVIYEGSGTAKVRAIVGYDSSPVGILQTSAMLHGLPMGRRVCLCAAHVVSIDDTMTDVVSRPVCALPR